MSVCLRQRTRTSHNSIIMAPTPIGPRVLLFSDPQHLLLLPGLLLLLNIRIDSHAHGHNDQQPSNRCTSISPGSPVEKRWDPGKKKRFLIKFQRSTHTNAQSEYRPLLFIHYSSNNNQSGPVNHDRNRATCLEEQPPPPPPTTSIFK